MVGEEEVVATEKRSQGEASEACVRAEFAADHG